jgi:uncharacterized protein (TIRG00374 family)
MGANPQPEHVAPSPTPGGAPADSPRPVGRARLSGGRMVLLGLTAVSLYLLAPSIGEVFSAWDRLGDFDPFALPIALVLELASFACVWWLMALALRREHWDAVILSQLAGNAFNRVTPGGGATGTAVQARMLADAGFPYTTALTAITVQSLLVTAALVAMPVLVVPAVLTGTALPGSLLPAAWLGAAMFAIVAGVVGLFLGTRRPVQALGNGVARVVNRVRRHRPPVTALGDRLLAERDEIRATMGSRWPEAVGAAVGRWFFEYLVLLLALFAIDARPDPWSVLLAFVAASVLGLIPITPGGLGFVEAGLVATLAAAGIRAEEAVAATLLFRLVSFWLPLPIGAAAGWWFRRRYPRTARPRAGDTAPVVDAAADATAVADAAEAGSAGAA